MSYKVLPEVSNNFSSLHLKTPLIIIKAITSQVFLDLHLYNHLFFFGTVRIIYDRKCPSAQVNPTVHFPLLSIHVLLEAYDSSTEMSVSSEIKVTF